MHICIHTPYCTYAEKHESNSPTSPAQSASRSMYAHLEKTPNDHRQSTAAQTKEQSESFQPPSLPNGLFTLARRQLYLVSCPMMVVVMVVVVSRS